GPHRLGVAVAGQYVVDVGGGQAGLDGQAGQRGRVADRLAVGEVGPQQPLLQSVGPAVLGGQVEQPVGVEGVASPGGGEVQIETGGRGGLGDPALHGLGLIPGDPVLGRQVLDPVAGADPGRPGIELEAAPVDLDLVAVGETGQGGLEPSLPDIAPGTDHV